jgi:hypothetical protein
MRYMKNSQMMPSTVIDLQGRLDIVIDVANQESIAAFHATDAGIGATYLNAMAELGNPTVFLASDAIRRTAGTIIPIDSGQNLMT